MIFSRSHSKNREVFLGRTYSEYYRKIRYDFQIAKKLKDGAISIEDTDFL